MNTGPTFRVGCRQDGTAGLQLADHPSLRYGQGLLLHSLVDTRPTINQSIDQSIAVKAWLSNNFLIKEYLLRYIRQYPTAVLM